MSIISIDHKCLSINQSISLDFSVWWNVCFQVIPIGSLDFIGICCNGSLSFLIFLIWVFSLFILVNFFNIVYLSKSQTTLFRQIFVLFWFHSIHLSPILKFFSISLFMFVLFFFPEPSGISVSHFF